MQPIAVIGNWEYWQHGTDVYRNQLGNRGYMLAEGVPANARWECTIHHFDRVFRREVAA